MCLEGGKYFWGAKTAIYACAPLLLHFFLFKFYLFASFCALLVGLTQRRNPKFTASIDVPSRWHICFARHYDNLCMSKTNSLLFARQYSFISPGCSIWFLLVRNREHTLMSIPSSLERIRWYHTNTLRCPGLPWSNFNNEDNFHALSLLRSGSFVIIKLLIFLNFIVPNEVV